MNKGLVNYKKEYAQNPTVTFDVLPREKFLVWITRKIFRKRRDYEFILISLNGRTKYIQRGKPVALPQAYLEIVDKVPAQWRYGYKIIKD